MGRVVGALLAAAGLTMVVFAVLLVASPQASEDLVTNEPPPVQSVPPPYVVVEESPDDAPLSTADVTAVISASCGVVTTVIGLLTFKRAAQRDRLVNDRLAEMLKPRIGYDPPGAGRQDI